jgi:hypothetical protein
MIDEVADDLELGDGKRIIGRRLQGPLAASTMSGRETTEGPYPKLGGPDTGSFKSESASVDLFVQFVDKFKDHS